jgi:hypothetical protein
MSGVAYWNPDDDHWLPEEWITPAHQISDIEPETSPADQVRDARLATVHLLNDFAGMMLSALERNHDARDGLVTLFGIAYAMGLNICDGMSMTERSDRLGVARATLSKIGVAWNQAHDLPPSFHQKSAEANQTFARKRREVVATSNGAELPPHSRARAFKPMPELP